MNKALEMSNVVVKARLSALDSCVKGTMSKSAFVLGQSGRNTFLLGRHVEADCLVKDVDVSRRHATFKFHKGRWTVTDNKSLNGLSVNGEKLAADEPRQLADGNVISIGDAYAWSFEFPAKDERSSFMSAIDAKLKQALSKISEDTVNLDFRIKQGEMKRLELTSEKEALMTKLNEERNIFSKKQEDERLQFEMKLSADRQETIKEQRQEFEKRLAQDLAVMKEKQNAQSLGLENQIKESENRMKAVIKERDEMAQVMEAEKANVERQMQDMKAKFQGQVDELQLAFDSEKATAEEYKTAMDKLDVEFRHKLKQKQDDFEAQMAQEAKARQVEKAELAKMEVELETKRNEIAKLSKELDNQKRKCQEESTADSRKKAKTDFLSNCNNELKCSICDELFIEPLSLNCGHVYCNFCIHQWKQSCKGKTFTCPNCRQNITTQTKSIHLANLIESIYSDDANVDIKKERQQVVSERKEAEKQAASVKKKPSQTNPANFMNGHRRTSYVPGGANRGNSAQQQRLRAEAPNAQHRGRSFVQATPNGPGGGSLIRAAQATANAHGGGSFVRAVQATPNAHGGGSFVRAVPATTNALGGGSFVRAVPATPNVPGGEIRVPVPVTSATSRPTSQLVTSINGRMVRLRVIAPAPPPPATTTAAPASTTPVPNLVQTTTNAIMIDGRAVPIINIHD